MVPLSEIQAMRALCGSIVTAGALIGLGLTALAFGVRFQSFPEKHPAGSAFHDVYYGVPSMTTILVLLLCAFLVGLGIAFVGLAFHHERRFKEWQRLERDSVPPRTTV